jgi:hypothetical protein
MKAKMKDRTHGYRVGTHRTDAGQQAYKVLRDFWYRNRQEDNDLDDEVVKDHLTKEQAKALCAECNAALEARKKVVKPTKA